MQYFIKDNNVKRRKSLYFPQVESKPIPTNITASINFQSLKA